MVTDSGNSYDTAWVRVTVDPNGDGAADTEIGPGSVNLNAGAFKKFRIAEGHNLQLRAELFNALNL